MRVGVMDAQVPQSTAAPTRDSSEPSDRLTLPAPTGLPHTSREQRSGTAAPHHSPRSEGPDASIRMFLDPARTTRWRRSFRARYLFCMDSQGFTLGWYAEPLWGVSTGLMRPSGGVFLRFLDSLLDRYGSFAKGQKCER